MKAAEIYVKDAGGTYTTNSVHGVRSSCTHSAEEAARRQAEKLLGTAEVELEEVGKGNTFVRLFRATADA